ncbi:hypothetical protein ACWGPO_12830 [Achromobacter animicus]
MAALSLKEMASIRARPARVIREIAKAAGTGGMVWGGDQICAIVLARAELDQLVQAFSHVVMAHEVWVLAADFGDVLRSTFMMLDMGNAGGGQFFTPYKCRA